MTSYSYGTPGGGGNQERPKCWGNQNVYDYTSRECRGCHSLASCGEAITRIRNAQQAYQQPGLNPYGNAYVSPYAPRAVANPLPMYAPQVQQPQPQAAVQVRPAPIPVPVQQQTQLARQATTLPAPTQERYGWYYDPLYHQVAASPPPIRPQLEGESFVGRVAKNMFLASLESSVFQALLGIRQLVLPPKDPDEE